VRLIFISVTFSKFFNAPAMVCCRNSSTTFYRSKPPIYKRLIDQTKWKFLNRWLLTLAELLIRRGSNYLKGPGGYRSLHVTAADCATRLVCATPPNYAAHYRSPPTPCLVRRGDTLLFVWWCSHYNEGNDKHSWIFYSSLKCVTSARISFLTPRVYSPDNIFIN
jgi:hypothetical protein